MTMFRCHKPSFFLIGTVFFFVFFSLFSLNLSFAKESNLKIAHEQEDQVRELYLWISRKHLSDAFREMRPLLNVAPFEREILGTNNDLSYGTENMLSQIISSRGRFKIWHDPKLRETIQEQNLNQQNLSQTGLAKDGKTRIKGFSGLVLFGSILQRKSSLEISAWLCDTERYGKILEVDVFREVVDSDGLEEICGEIERKISREFPLVQGRIAKVQGSRILLDFGKEVRIKSGMKVFLYRSERVPKHIDTDLVCEATVLNKADNGLFISELIDDWCVGYVREGQWAITQ